MPIESSEITAIREIVNERIGRMEKTLFDEMEKLTCKVDRLTEGQSAINSRLSSAETKITSCEMSKDSQGRRIGEIEERVIINETMHKERERFTSILQWGIPGVAALCGLVYWFAGVVK